MLPPIHVLEKQTVGAGGVASVTFTIGTLVSDWDTDAGVTSRHLVILVNAKSEDAVAQRDITLQFNADGGANYNDEEMTGVGAVDAAAIRTGQTTIIPFPIPGSTVHASAHGGGVILIPHAFGTDNHKAVLSYGGAAEDEIKSCAGRWANVAAITSIVLSTSAGDIAENSTFILAVVDERFLIEEQLLTGDGTVTFSNIPQGDGDLCVIGYMRSDRVAIPDSLNIQINGDTTATNYQRQLLYGEDAGTAASTVNNNYVGATNGDSSTASAFSAMLATFYQYAKGVNDPSWLSMSGFHNTLTTPNGFVSVVSGRRTNVEAITQIKYQPVTGTDFKAGTLISLYYLPSPREIIERKEFVVSETGKTFRCGDFDNDFEALAFHYYARGDEAAVGDEVQLSLNANTTAATYDTQELTGTGAVVAAVQSAASRVIGYITADSEGANEFGCGSVLLPEPFKTDRHKHGISISGQTENNVAILSTRFESTDAIATVNLTPVGSTNLIAGTFIEEAGVVPLDTTITKKQDVAKQQQLLRPYGKRWRH